MLPSPKAALLVCLCLLGLSYHASAQTKALALAPLPPRIVLLDSGTVLSRPLVGLTPDAYDALSAGQASDEQLLLVRAAELVNLRKQHRADSLSLVAGSNEIRRLRDERAHAYALLSRSELAFDKLGSRPLQKPMLLDINFYKGFLAGLLTGGVLGAKYLP